jgi:anaerobic ribonucleoside-triphosphate reductase activating protein
MSAEEFGYLWRDVLDRGAQGLTVSGGEPLAQPGPLAELLAEADRIGTEVGARTNAGYDTLVYSGYELSELDDPQLAAARYADVVITGRFDAGREAGLIWRGSANQQMLHRHRPRPPPLRRVRRLHPAANPDPALHRRPRRMGRRCASHRNPPLA